MTNYQDPKQIQNRLDYYYRGVKAIILNRQNPNTGLLPASVAVTTHGDYRDAWVRDNVYSILAVYGLALAYRRTDDSNGRAYELEHSVIKLMRGLLFAMMRQSHKVEKFKITRSLDDCLHAKYNTNTGDTVVGDNEWGHLQIDATSIFLLMLAQMTASGFQIIYSLDEVDFIQNLVFYIERAYRTPDYGIWERGNKVNHGEPELNSSSIGMAVAALQAINDMNLFGSYGGPSSVIHVLPDEITRNFDTLHAALPRESRSKEIDAAILSIIGYPAYAVGDPEILTKTRKEIETKLRGKYGFKRFLRDGHQTVLEDRNRLWYDPRELQIFENIECEWPLFFAYSYVDGLMTGDIAMAEDYRESLEPVLVDSASLVGFGQFSNEFQNPVISSQIPPRTPPHSPRLLRDHFFLVPELYYVPSDKVKEEKHNPHSQIRFPNDNIPLVWANSLYILGNLLSEKLLSPAEIDPLGRRFQVHKSQHNDTIVQIALLAEDASLQKKLATYGLETQTLDQVKPISVRPPSSLVDVYSGLGMNEKLGLSGRPNRPIGTLGTCRIYRVQGHLFAFTPHFMDKEEFYIISDNSFFVSTVEQELSFVQKHWTYSGRPTLILMLTHNMIDNSSKNSRRSTENDTDQQRLYARDQRALLNFIMTLRTGVCNNVRVRLGKLPEMINTSCIISLDFLVDKTDIDWKNILYGSLSRRGSSIRLRSSNEGRRRPSSIRRSMSGSKLTSPFNKLDGFDYQTLSKTFSSFKLRDHQEVENDHPTISHQPSEPYEGLLFRPKSPLVDYSTETNESLSLVLNDPSQLSAAISALTSSNNLFDQIDLLQYISSCHGLDFFVELLSSSVRDLIEEVYLKSLSMKLWSVARQAAGILKKSVNSLTINVTDLIISQKDVTIGASDEYFIHSAIGPEELTNIIYDRCYDDIREGPVVQEIITYLGNFIRTKPSMFNGIMRLRTHFIIIALREEISRMRNCDEEDAVEYLMQISPFEMKCLLGTILSGSTLSSNNINTLFKDHFSTQSPLSWSNLNFNPVNLFDDTLLGPRSTQLIISAQSGGFSAGNFSRIEINNTVIPISSRGLNAVILDPFESVLLDVSNFDTHISYEDSEDFAKLIDWLQPGVIVVLAVKDDCAEHLTEAARRACSTLGSDKIHDVRFRDSWCLIGQKGIEQGNAVETYRSSDEGATDILHKIFDLSNYKEQRDIPGVTKKDSILRGPSSGRWLRRRKNDGALNRVPQNFYPKVWKVLERSGSICVGNICIGKDPIIYEKTPEETNFARTMEAFLDVLQDPAERQIAVECLHVFHTMIIRHPDSNIAKESLDLNALIHQAISKFWKFWVSSKKQRKILPNSSLASPRDNFLRRHSSNLKFAKEEDLDEDQSLSRKYFFDLPPDSERGTIYFLAESILHFAGLVENYSWISECMQEFSW